MKKDLNNISDYLLGKWINKNLSEEEAEEVNNWMYSSDENAGFIEDVEHISSDLDDLTFMSSINSNLGISKVKSRIKKYSEKPFVQSKLFTYLQKVAVIIVIPLTLIS